MNKAVLNITKLGLKSYQECLDIQERLHAQVKAGELTHQLVLCSHPPVITLGTSAEEKHILASPEDLKRAGVEVTKVTRGGNVTYHGPGQLIAYPIVDLRIHGKRDVGWYMRSLEEVVIRTLGHYCIKAERIDGKTGVWINNPPRKISSIGVRLRRWCTLHGIAFNVFEEPGFGYLNPCGMEGVLMTSLEKELQEATARAPLLSQVEEHFISNFLEVFSFADSN